MNNEIINLDATTSLVIEVLEEFGDIASIDNKKPIEAGIIQDDNKLQEFKNSEFIKREINKSDSKSLLNNSSDNKDTVNYLKAKILALRKDNDCLKEDNFFLKNQNYSLNQQIFVMEKANVCLQTKLQNSVEKNNSYENSIVDLNTKLVNQANQIALLKSELQVSRDQIDAQLDELIKYCDCLKSENLDLKIKNEAIDNETVLSLVNKE